MNTKNVCQLWGLNSHSSNGSKITIQLSYRFIDKSSYPISCFWYRVAVGVFELEQAVRLTFTGATEIVVQ